jgi:uncharacterized RDD family membrane protein YckC
VALDLEPATVGLEIGGHRARPAADRHRAAPAGVGRGRVRVHGVRPDWLGIALVLLLVFALQFGYPVGFETLWRGRTPGKAAMGLRVVTVEGAPVRFRHAATRAAIGLLELTGTAGAIAVIASLSSARGQRLGDLAAGTLVIRERRARGRPGRCPSRRRPATRTTSGCWTRADSTDATTPRSATCCGET